MPLGAFKNEINSCDHTHVCVMSQAQTLILRIASKTCFIALKLCIIMGIALTNKKILFYITYQIF